MSVAFDDVIDPAQTRDRIITFLGLTKRPRQREATKHYVDTW